MAKEDQPALTMPLLCRVAQGPTTQDDVQVGKVKRGSSGGVPSHYDQVSSANSSDGERLAIQTSDEYTAAPHLVSAVDAEDVTSDMHCA